MWVDMEMEVQRGPGLTAELGPSRAPAKPFNSSVDAFPLHTHPPLLKGQSGRCHLAFCSQPAPGISIQEHTGPPSPLVRGWICSHGDKESIPLLNLVTSL